MFTLVHIHCTINIEFSRTTFDPVAAQCKMVHGSPWPQLDTSQQKSFSSSATCRVINTTIHIRTHRKKLFWQLVYLILREQIYQYRNSNYSYWDHFLWMVDCRIPHNSRTLSFFPVLDPSLNFINFLKHVILSRNAFLDLFFDAALIYNLGGVAHLISLMPQQCLTYN